MPDPSDLPAVTVVMPVRNEAGAIGAALGSVLGQTYPAERMQVLVVDGRSDDGTRAEVEQAAGGDRRVRVLDNPAGTTPHALNLGLRAATGAVIVRVDGHCALPPDYLVRCVELIEETGADAVGGVIETRGTTRMARAIAAAQSSFFGVGTAKFRTGARQPGPVDTLAFGAYRREVFDRLGEFDEELVRNQDDEFNLRLVLAGGTIWLDPTLRSMYTSRATLPRLWRQYHQYGEYKVRVVQKHRRVASLRWLAPLGLIAALGASAGAAAVLRRPRLAWAVVGPYLVADAAATVRAGRSDPATLPVLPLAFPTLHLAYGLGTLTGLWRWRSGWTTPAGGNEYAKRVPISSNRC